MLHYNDDLLASDHSEVLVRHYTKEFPLEMTLFRLSELL